MQDLVSHINTRKELFERKIKVEQQGIAEDLQTVHGLIKSFKKCLRELEESLNSLRREQKVTKENNKVDEKIKEKVSLIKRVQARLSYRKETVIELQAENKEYQQAELYLQKQHRILQLSIEFAKLKLHKGSTSSRIQKFHKFRADESIVGDRCSVCLEDVLLGRRMMRLDCQHVFCQGCVKGWFADHNTCLNCRHLFR